MNKSFSHLALLPFFLLLLAVGSVASYAKVPIGNTVFWWAVDGFCLLLMWDFRAAISRNDRTHLLWVHVYLCANVISIFMGMFLAHGYWEWKALVANAMGLLMPMAAFLAFNEFNLGQVLQFSLKIVLPCFFLVFSFVTPDSFGFYLAMLTVFILFIDVMPLRWRFLVLILSGIVLVSDLGARSNVLKIIVSLLLLSVMKLRRFFVVPFWGWSRWILIYAPLVLFSLGIFGVFNIFEMDKYMREVSALDSYGDYGEDLKADTRTFLFVDVLNTAKKHNSWLIGRTPARGNETEFFIDAQEFFRKGERSTNEAAILNVFTWTGAVGVFLYFMIFAHASYLAVFCSNNDIAKVMGLLCSFNWAYSWVENGNFFNAAYFTLFLIVGICLSPSFREKSDVEMRVWLGLIFGAKSYGRMD